MQTASVVYLIASAGLVKIGVTRDLPARLQTLQNMGASPVEVLATYPGWQSLEAKLHKHFAAKRHHGEWFALTANDLQEVKTICKGAQQLRCKHCNAVFAPSVSLRVYCSIACRLWATDPSHAYAQCLPNNRASMRLPI